MSYILEALKKLEQKREQEEPPRLFVFSHDSRSTRRRRLLWPYLLAGVLLLNAVAMIWWVSERRVEKGGAVTEKVAVPRRSPPPAALAAPEKRYNPPAEAPGTKRETPRPAQDVMSRAPAATAAAPVAAPATPAAAPRRAAPDVPQPAAAKAVEPERPQAQSESREEKSKKTAGRVLAVNELPAAVRAALPEFKISGHAYSPEPQTRVTRINEKILQEGQELTPGLRLEEIVPEPLKERTAPYPGVMENGPVKTGKDKTKEPARATGSRPSPMEERICARMGSAGLLSYQAFLETVLYDEQHGYYRAGKQGRQDYCTSPEIHALFGRTIGGYIEALCDRIRSPSVSILELGGASGKLAADIISAFTHLTLETYSILEKGKERRSGAIRWINSLDRLEGVEGFTFILANEFFDALPFHRVIDRGGGLEEVYVGHRDGFFEQTGPLSRPLASFLDDYPIFLQEHQEMEVTPAAAPVEAISRLVGKGCFLVFDYGYHQADITAGRFFHGSMLAYKDRRIRDDLFASLGTSDITHHVNFDHIDALLQKAGWRKDGEIEQYRFLHRAGVLERLGGLTVEEKMAAKWLIMPEGLGSTISVLGFSRGLQFPLPGFEGQCRVTSDEKNRGTGRKKGRPERER
jgi:SAM-dependent MidA family methyltransferase